MQVLECPQDYKPRSHGLLDVLIFLGGGISNCPDWQKEMIERFKDEEKLILINPRRKDFDITDPKASEFQIEWEYRHLHVADAVIFWFPYHTLCPITLYELGSKAAQGKRLFVGCHPAYARKFDVTKQLSLIRPEVKVHDNFADLVEEVKKWHRDLINF